MATVNVTPLEVCSGQFSAGADGVVVVGNAVDSSLAAYSFIGEAWAAQQKIDNNFSKKVSLISCPQVPGGRLVFSPIGPINRDYDDVRRYYDAAEAGVKRAIEAGCQFPVLVTLEDEKKGVFSERFVHAKLVAALGALHAVYTPLEIREAPSCQSQKLQKLSLWNMEESAVKQLHALEGARIVARDIGGSDPERMAPPRVAEFVQQVFANGAVKVSVMSDQKQLEKDYPCFAAVNRATRDVERHHGRVIHLEYKEGTPKETIILVGKGVTYDTGGADIKAGGVMAGMHRDKCGAAAVAGFFTFLELYRPKNIHVIGGMAMVRNSVGSNCYVSDELITARSGVRVRVGNTDAEGRMAMVDVLCHMKERAVQEKLVKPRLMTIATLTGHACLTYGDGYAAIMDNGPAMQLKNAETLQAAGDAMADPFEISTLRREDYNFHRGPSEYEDVLQCNNAPSSRTPRGHNTPGAFLIITSGLDKHGVDSAHPLAYSHLDIAAAAGPFPGIPSASPVLALAKNLL